MYIKRDGNGVIVAAYMQDQPGISGLIVIDDDEYRREVESFEAMADLRAERNRLLDEADLKYCNAERWSAMTPETRSAWSAYKQALRDLPENIDADNPVWPSMPS